MGVDSVHKKLCRVGAALILITHVLGLVAVLAMLGPAIAALLCYLVVAVIILGYRALVRATEGRNHGRSENVF